jgi:hypothetical protein
VVRRTLDAEARRSGEKRGEDHPPFASPRFPPLLAPPRQSVLGLATVCHDE